MTNPAYPYLQHQYPGGRRYTMTARQLISRVFPGQDYGTKVPPEVSGIAVIDGVNVEYLTREDAYARAGRRSNTPMRAWALCPACNKLVTASRINQHARVHVTRPEVA